MSLTVWMLLVLVLVSLLLGPSLVVAGEVLATRLWVVANPQPERDCWRRDGARGARGAWRVASDGQWLWGERRWVCE